MTWPPEPRNVECPYCKTIFEENCEYEWGWGQIYPNHCWRCGASERGGYAQESDHLWEKLTGWFDPHMPAIADDLAVVTTVLTTIFELGRRHYPDAPDDTLAPTFRGVDRRLVESPISPAPIEEVPF